MPPFLIETRLTLDQIASRGTKAFVRDAIASGRLRGVEDAIREAMALWERRERASAEILASVDAAETALARASQRGLVTRK